MSSMLSFIKQKKEINPIIIGLLFQLQSSYSTVTMHKKEGWISVSHRSFTAADLIHAYFFSSSIIFI